MSIKNKPIKDIFSFGFDYLVAKKANSGETMEYGAFDFTDLGKMSKFKSATVELFESETDTVVSFK